MKSWMVFFISITSAVSMVNCVCSHFGKRGMDTKQVCEEFWNNALGSNNDKAKIKCITWITEHCPNMLHVETLSMNRKVSYLLNHEAWTLEMKANYKDSQLNYHVHKHRSICFDDDDTEDDCDYWWSVASSASADTEAIMWCLKRLRDHCSSRLTRTEEISNKPKNQYHHDRKVTYTYNPFKRAQNSETTSYVLHVLE